jgi:hypothetical protein
MSIFVPQVLLLVAAVASSDPLHVAVRQTLILDEPAATAVYAVDGAIADASIGDGHVLVHGRTPGSTVLSVVTSDDVRTYRVIVNAPHRVDLERVSSLSRSWTLWEGFYDSGASRLTNTVDVLSRGETWTARVHVANVTQTDPRPDGDARTSFPSAALELSDSGHALVLLDQTVEQSPLTLDGTSLRGVHYRDSSLELHAGVTSPVLFRNVILPADPEAAVGGSYRWSWGRSAIGPALYYFDGNARYGGTRGAMATLLYAYGGETDKLRLRSELGYGKRPGASLQLAYDGEAHRVKLDFRHQPDGIASVGVARPHGTFADAAWTCTIAPRLGLDLSGSAARHDLPLIRERSATSAGELRFAFGGGWSARAGATLADFKVEPGGSLQSVTLPFTFAYDDRYFGASAQYRRQRNTGSNEGGNGGRLGIRGTWAAWQARAFVDYQRDAATLDLIFRQIPDLQGALTELGVEARTPQDLERVFHDNAALAQLGVVEGVSINLHPWRMQSGGDIAWVPNDDARQQLRARLLIDRARGVLGTQQTTIGTVSYSRRIVGALEAIASFTGWARSTGSSPAVYDWAYGVGLRMRFDGAPRLPSIFSPPSITGFVYRDDQATGAYSEGMPTVAGARLLLDGLRAGVTDARGRFTFDDVGEGPHRVDLELEPWRGAFFTTSSAVTVNGGGEASFGIAQAPARVTGFVLDDSAAAIPDVTVKLTGEGENATAVTDSSGRYEFAVREGSYELAVVTSLLPVGYDSSASPTHRVQLLRDVPERTSFTVVANRSISGKVNARNPTHVIVRLLGTAERQVNPNADGRYVFRHLAPGRYTVEVAANGQRVRREILVPDGPAQVSGTDFDINQQH